MPHDTDMPGEHIPGLDTVLKREGVTPLSFDPQDHITTESLTRAQQPMPQDPEWCKGDDPNIWPHHIGTIAECEPCQAVLAMAVVPTVHFGHTDKGTSTTPSDVTQREVEPKWTDVTVSDDAEGEAPSGTVAHGEWGGGAVTGSDGGRPSLARDGSLSVTTGAHGPAFALVTGLGSRAHALHPVTPVGQTPDTPSDFTESDIRGFTERHPDGITESDMTESDPAPVTPGEGDTESIDPADLVGTPEREVDWPSTPLARLRRLEHLFGVLDGRITEHRVWQDDMLRTVAENRHHAESVGDVAAHAVQRAVTLHEGFTTMATNVGHIRDAQDRVAMDQSTTAEAAIALRHDLEQTIRRLDGMAGRLDGMRDRTDRLTRNTGEHFDQITVWRDAVNANVTDLSGRLRSLEQIVETWDPQDEWTSAVDDAIQQHRERLEALERTAAAVRLLLPAVAVPDSDGADGDARPATIEAQLPDGRTVTLPTGPAPGSAPKRTDPLMWNRMRVEGARRYVGALIRDYERNAPHHPGTSARALLDLKRVAELLNGVDL